jgi:hypothetical protein
MHLYMTLHGPRRPYRSVSGSLASVAAVAVQLGNEVGHSTCMQVIRASLLHGWRLQILTTIIVDDDNQWVIEK